MKASKTLLTLLTICSLLSIQSSKAQHLLGNDDVYLYPSSTERGYISPKNLNSPDIIIPPYLQGSEVRGISPWSFQSKNLTSVVLPSTLLSIGRYSFYNNNLTSIQIPNNVTNIENQAFNRNNFSSFTFTLPSPTQNGKWASYQPSSSSDTTFYTNGSSVSELGHNYTYIQDLSSIPVTEPYILTDSDVLVSGNGYLAKVTLPEGTTNVIIPSSLGGKTITTIGWGVFQDKRLTNVVIPEGVIHISAQAFMGNNLKTITLPQSLIRIDYNAFRDNHLENILLPDNLEVIGRSCFQNNQLKSISLPNSLRSIEYSSFADNHLSSFTLPSPSITGKWITSEEEYLKGAVIDNLSKIYLYDSETTYTLTDEDVIVTDGKIEKVLLPTPNPYNRIIIPPSLHKQKITHIGNSTFGNKNLTHITLPEGLTHIGGSAFYGNFIKTLQLPSG